MSWTPVRISKRWAPFVAALAHYEEITLVGPMAGERRDWPVPCLFVDRANRFQQNDPLHCSVGDGDSAWGDLDVELNPEKDFSDLAFALRQIPLNIKRVSMLGFLGGRRDHELMNLGELHHFLKARAQATEVDLDWSVVGLSAGSWHLLLQGLFTVAVFEPTALRLAGACKYKVEGAELFSPVSSRGLSNEGFGRVEIDLQGPAFIFKNPLT